MRELERTIGAPVCIAIPPNPPLIKGGLGGIWYLYHGSR